MSISRNLSSFCVSPNPWTPRTSIRWIRCTDYGLQTLVAVHLWQQKDPKMIQDRDFRSKLGGALSVAAAGAFSVTAVVASAGVSAGFEAVAASSLLLVTVASPWLFVRWQRHKDTIHGPWDEAVPKIVDHSAADQS